MCVLISIRERSAFSKERTSLKQGVTPPKLFAKVIKKIQITKQKNQKVTLLHCKYNMRSKTVTQPKKNKFNKGTKFF